VTKGIFSQGRFFLPPGKPACLAHVNPFFVLHQRQGSPIILPVRDKECGLRQAKGRTIMTDIATTKMSSKGQVVIPERIRKQLNLRAGSQFVVVGDKDVVILRAIETPSMDQFDELVRRARQQARAAGMKRSDVTAAVAKVRGRK
jgi:AbrB family looped-hinge helix DNA binding protein